MVWILLAALGVAVWLVIGALAAGLWSRHAFKQAPGVFPAKLRVVAGKVAGADASWPRLPLYARWVHDVLLVHRGFALVRVSVLPVASVSGPLVDRPPEELPGLGSSPAVHPHPGDAHSPNRAVPWTMSLRRRRVGAERSLNPWT